MRFSELNKKIFKMFILGTLIISLILIGIDIKGFGQTFIEFNPIYIIYIGIFIILSYSFRFIKWIYYLKLIKIQVPKKESLKIFLAAIPMTITPGKVGEFLKSFLLKAKYNYPISITSPIVIVERVTDALGMLILAGIGAMVFDFGLWILLFVLIAVIIFILIIQNEKLCLFLISFFEMIPFIKRRKEWIINFYQNINDLLKKEVLILGTILGMFTWICEGAIVYYVAKGAGGHITFTFSIFILAFSSIIGVISMIPGGIVASEGSILVLLINRGLTYSMSSFVVLMVRIATLWIGVIIGSFALIHIEKELKKGGFEDFKIQGEFIENS